MDQDDLSDFIRDYPDQKMLLLSRDLDTIPQHLSDNHKVLLSPPFLPCSFSEAAYRLHSDLIIKNQQAFRTSAATSGTRGTKRILLAEDNPTNQKVIGQQLSLLGYEFEIAANGVHALNMLRDTHYDLLLCDCHMPEMGGFELTERIRKSPQPIAKLPIIAITTDALSGDADKCFDAGLDGYLSKPVELETLRETLNEWLAKTHIDQVDGQ